MLCQVCTLSFDGSVTPLLPGGSLRKVGVKGIDEPFVGTGIACSESGGAVRRCQLHNR